MAITRREFLAFASGIAGAWACARSSGRQVRTPTGGQALHAQPGPANARTVLALMPDTPQTQAVWTGLSDELGGEFSLVAVQVEDRDSSQVIADAVQRYRPSALVLMNNPTVAAYRHYLTLPNAARGIPAVVVMTSFLESKSKQLAQMGAAGITYEVPLITVVTNLRRIVASPVERIGIIYRTPLAGFLRRQKELAAREQIQVVALEVDTTPNVSELKRGIRLLKLESDAVWVMNDDRLLTPQLIAGAWLPGLNERPWRPTIVGAASLVSSATSFGTFAVLPDHTALGDQAAGLIFEIADNDWKLPRSAVDQPLSVKTTVDMAQVRERFPLRDDALARVDRVIE